jgi:hypothetical protein
MKITVRNGLIAAAIIILLKLLVKFAGLEKMDFTGAIALIALIFLIWQAGVVVRREHHNTLTYGEAFNTGMSVTFWAALVSAVLMYTIYKFVDHDSVRLIQDQIPKAVEKQQVPDDQRDALQNTLTHIVGPGFLAIIHFITYILIGLVISLIIAAIIKRDPDPADSQTNYNHDGSSL